MREVSVAMWIEADDEIRILGNQNAFLVKRTQAGGVRFSRDPLNLTNLHSRKVCPPGTAISCLYSGLTSVRSMLVLSTTRCANSPIECGTPRAMLIISRPLELSRPRVTRRVLLWSPRTRRAHNNQVASSTRSHLAEARQTESMWTLS